MYNPNPIRCLSELIERGITKDSRKIIVRNVFSPIAITEGIFCQNVSGWKLRGSLLARRKFHARIGIVKRKQFLRYFIAAEGIIHTFFCKESVLIIGRD